MQVAVPSGEHLKFAIGGASNGPCMCPSFNRLSISLKITPGWSKADHKFLQDCDFCVPMWPIDAPTSIIFNNASTNSQSGYSARYEAQVALLRGEVAGGRPVGNKARLLQRGLVLGQVGGAGPIGKTVFSRSTFLWLGQGLECTRLC